MNNKLTISLVASFFLATNLFSATELETITITSATKSTQSIKDVTSNVEVITKEDIQERHFTTVSEALNTIAGVSFVNNGSVGNTTSIFLRGMDTQRILVLVDGVRYQDPSNTSGASFADLIISDIERIEVIKGAQSGVWGADAAAGVINIITQDSKVGTAISTNIELGSFLSKKYGLSISNKTKLYDVKISANRILTDGFSAQSTYGQDLNQYEDDGYRNTTINAKAGLNISDGDRLVLSVNHVNSFVEYDNFAAPNSVQRTDNESILYSISYSKNIENHSIRLKHDISDFQKENLDATFGVKFYNGKTQVTDLIDNISYASNSNLLVGASYEKYEADYITTSNLTNKESNNNKAIYLTNMNNFDKFIFTQSIRRDDYSNFGSKVTGKIGAKYQINNDLSLTGNYGTAYNAPNIIQMLNPWGTTNLNLNPEETKGYDISLDYKTFSFTYFNNNVKDLISWSGGGYNNLEGTSKINGYELKYSKDVLTDAFLSINYTHLSAKNASNQELGRRPKNQIGTSFDYYGIDKLHFNINASYIGTRYDSNNKAGRQTGRYTLWNSVINYEVNKTFSTYLKVDNLFDKQYQTVDGYSTAQRSGYIGIKASF